MLELAFTILLSLLAPGAGQIYAGRWAEGLFFGAVYSLGLYVAAPLAARLASSREGKLRVAYWANILYVCIIAISVVDAAARCFFHPPSGPFPGGWLWTAMLSGVMLVTLYRNLRRPGLIDALAAMPEFSKLVLYRRRAAAAE